MTRATGLALLILASIAPGVAAQDLASLVGDREVGAELTKIVAAAELNGLPADPIVAKIRYAVLVAHAPAPRILTAARAVAARLEEARDALAPHPTPTDITEGEKALSSSVSVKSLQEIRKASPNRPVAVALGVLTQLVAEPNKVPEKDAARYVAQLIRRRASDKQLADLGNDVNTDVALGRGATTAQSALELRMKGLNAVLGMPGATTEAASPAAIQSGDGKKKP